MSLPKVQVLQFEKRLTHCVWYDYIHRCRTMDGLIKHLRREVKAKRIMGYRLLTIHREVRGVG